VKIAASSRVFLGTGTYLMCFLMTVEAAPP
jgi:hypothetical protein